MHQSNGKSSRVLRLSLAFAVFLVPSAGTRQIVEQCSWTSSSIDPPSKDVSSTPVVADVDADGMPDVVFVTFRSSTGDLNGEDGILRVISGDDCQELYSVADVGVVTCVDGVTMSLDERGDIGFLIPGAGAAVGDIDGDSKPEIVGVAEGPSPNQIQRLVAFEHDGTFKWCSEPALTTFSGFGVSPALADLDHDGSPEIVVGNKVFNVDGTLRWDAGPNSILRRASVAADLDGIVGLEVVPGGEAYHSDGSLYWERPDLTGLLFPAIADFDLDGAPEVVTVGSGLVYLLDGQTGSTRCVGSLPPVDQGSCQQSNNNGGPPTLADIDGDGVPEIGVAGRTAYSLFAFDGTPGPGCLQLLWSQPILDCSSGFTGSTMFDLEGDGSVEVLYNDEFHFWIFRATDGEVLLEEFDNTSRTLHEYPALADVDADGQAEIILGANVKKLVNTNGIRILHDPNVKWTPTRAIFNQHAYHITSVEDDSTIPTVEENSWEQHNNYRVQVVGTLPSFTSDCGATIQASVGAEVTLTVSAEETDPEDVLKLTVADLPAGATMTPSLPTSGNPVSSTFDWTPQNNDVGIHVVTFTVTDSAGFSESCEVNLSVAECFMLLGLTPTSFSLPWSLEDTLLVIPMVMFEVTLDDIPVLPIPNNPNVVGLHIYGQVYMENPIVFPEDPYQMSNGLDVTLGVGYESYGTATGMQLWLVEPPAIGGVLEFAFSIDGFP